MGVAVFDYHAFTDRYPEFVGKITKPVADLYFAEAGLYLNNTDSSIVSDVNIRTALLYMLVAHIASLNGVLSDGTASAVGRLSSATEGSVSVGLEYAAPANGTQAWFQQTQYGVSFWAATARFRTMRYVGVC